MIMTGHLVLSIVIHSRVGPVNARFVGIFMRVCVMLLVVQRRIVSFLMDYFT